MSLSEQGWVLQGTDHIEAVQPFRVLKGSSHFKAVFLVEVDRVLVLRQHTAPEDHKALAKTTSDLQRGRHQGRAETTVLPIIPNAGTEPADIFFRDRPALCLEPRMFAADPEGEFKNCQDRGIPCAVRQSDDAELVVPIDRVTHLLSGVPVVGP